MPEQTRPSGMERRSFLRTVGAVGVGTALAGCPAGGATSGDHDVGMTTRKFRPAKLEVPPGTTVVWKNTSSHAHTVTAYESQIPDGADYWASGDFDSQADAVDAWTGGFGGRLSQSQSFEHTFEVVGTHHYYCIPHEASGMKGRIVVTEDATPPGE